MSLITQLSREDVMFVAGETDNIYQHIGALVVLDTSDRPGFDFEHFRQHCMERIALIPHFRWKLHSVPMGLDRPYWVEDENFNFDHHIKHIALPSPGDKAALCEVAAHLYAKHLDRSRPLWEMWLIEGLEDGRFAYIQKFHHCMMDGEGAFRMIDTICDFEADPKGPKVVDKSISEARAGHVPSFQESRSNAWEHIRRLPGEAARSAYDVLRPKVLEQFVWPRKSKVEQPEVPIACFNGPISSDRALTYASLPLAEMKRVKQHFGVTLNDVVLAMVSSTVRRYLLDYAELPEASLRTSIPVSLRTSEDEDLSNRVTNVTVTLATDEEEPAARLMAIHEESEQAKEVAHSGSKGIVELFQMMPPIMVSTLMESLSDEQAPQMLGANLIVSNVRGSPLSMYMAGARMDRMYSMSILSIGLGINFTCVSYVDCMDFGIMCEPDLVPHHENLATGLEDGLAEYLKLCEPKKRKPAKKSKAKPKKASRKQPKKKSVAKSSADKKSVKKATKKTGKAGRARAKPPAK